MLCKHITENLPSNRNTVVCLRVKSRTRGMCHGLWAHGYHERGPTAVFKSQGRELLRLVPCSAVLALSMMLFSSLATVLASFSFRELAVPLVVRSAAVSREVACARSS